MSNSNHFQMFFLEPRAEATTLSLLRSIAGFGIESSDARVKDAVGFAQVALHPHGYAQSWRVSWPGNIALAVELEELAHRVAIALAVSVLLEPQSAEDEWRVFSPDGSSLEVEVDYVTDGIEVSFWGQDT